MMHLGPIGRYVLELAVEDYYGLFELLHDDPHAPDEMRHASVPQWVLVPAIAELLGAGLVEIKYRPNPLADLLEVGSDEAGRLLEDPDSWAVPGPTSRIVVVGATQLGEDLLLSLGRPPHRES